MQKLEIFFRHLNDQSDFIKFTMEFEVDCSLPFLDVLISRNDEGSFTHQVFRKKTHTEQYLHASSHHFPAHKSGVLSTLATRAFRIADEHHLEDEKSHLLKVFLNNGYSKVQCLRAFQKAEKGPRVKKEHCDRLSGVHLPFIQGTIDKIARILRRHKVPSTFKPLRTIQSSLRSVKDSIFPNYGKGVNLIPCSCETPYIDETGRSISQRNHEHAADLKHNRSRSSALAEHAERTKHHIFIEDAKVIARIDHFHHRKLREALEIENRPVNLNRDDGWSVSRCWIPALHS